MKPLQKILLILKTIVPVIILLLGISCSNPDNQNNTSGQKQSVEEHVHSDDEGHDEHDHDAHDQQ